MFVFFNSSYIQTFKENDSIFFEESCGNFQFFLFKNYLRVSDQIIRLFQISSLEYIIHCRYFYIHPTPPENSRVVILLIHHFSCIYRKLKRTTELKVPLIFLFIFFSLSGFPCETTVYSQHLDLFGYRGSTPLCQCVIRNSQDERNFTWESNEAFLWHV